MNVILEEYGAVFLDMGSRGDRSDAAQWFNYAGNYLAGGNNTHDAGYYEMKLSEIGGTTVSGTIIGGEFDGESGTFSLEVDPDMIEEYASDGDFSDGPYESWAS